MSEEKQPYNLMMIRNGLSPKTTGKKERKPIKKISDKLKAEREKEKVEGSDSELDLFFERMRKRMTGKCLFCGGKTEKHNDDFYRTGIAHLLPKRPVDKGGFPSVGTNEDNWIELCFYGESCHTNFDSGKITWEFIFDSKEGEVVKEKLMNVLPLVAMEERKHKLYSKLEKLIYNQ